ncbi:MAG: undecaprenyl-phosphate glucose phosphotransferase [Chitinophagaceae bacterium]|nr:undecaprenyl-phosphate glucose phosphotransferase [Chitinophagaceae bacterium]
MNKQFLRFLQATLFSLDVIILNLVFIICKAFFNEHIPNQYSNSYFEYWILINSFWVIFAWFGRVYSEKSILSFELFSARTMKAYIIWFTFLILYLFFTKEVILSRLFILTTIVAFGFGLFLNRFAYIGIKMYLKKANQLVKRILIIGYNKTSKKLALYLEQEGINTEILGFTENEKNVNELSHYPIISDIDLSVEVSKQLKVDEIFSTITPEQDPRLYHLIRQAEDECIRFRIVPDFSVFIKGPFHVSYFNDMPILTLRSESLDDFNNRVKKRVFDIFFSFFVIVFILSWLVPLLSILIFLESRGPIFFSQLRTGKNKKTFRCYKFRSMYVNKDAEVKQATKDDKRITKIGKILRRTSLDEFPQFLNVLIGNMSIVGPRPHMVTHTDHYSKIVNQYMVRHFSKPGITGWAQINGYRGQIEEPAQIRKRVEYDIWYLDNWSLLLDIKIVFLTVFNVLKGEEKAY